MKGRLNVFQATMLRWKALHPYNAVHVVRIEQPLDGARLREAIRNMLEAAGLTHLTLDDKRMQFEYAGGPVTPALEVRATPTDEASAIAAEIERQLNLPFRANGYLEPLRFFAFPAAGGFIFGLGYDHLIAGGDSIVLMIRDIVRRYSDESASPPPQVLYPRTPPRAVLRNALAIVRGAGRIPSMVASLRSTLRPRLTNPADGYNGYASFRLAPREFQALLATTKQWGVTLNDMLLALLLLALDPMTRERRDEPRRKQLAVASIMNLRRDLAGDARTTFGQFLGSFRVSHPVPSGISLKDLAQDVHRDTSRIKSRRLYLHILLAMRMNGWLWRLYSRPQQQKLYAKSYPVWAGVTTVNVNALWERKPGSDPPEYFRGVSTGPLSPLVVAVTTSGDTLHAGISYRTTAFDAAKIATLWADIHSRIASLG